MEHITSLTDLNLPKLANWACRYTLPGNVETDEYILPVSGGADSTALAIILHKLYPTISWRMCFTDTGAEESNILETLDLLESFLGKKIERLTGGETLFSLIDKWNGFLPSSQQRYCTNHLKRSPFEAWLKQFKGTQKHMFIGIRSDEKDRLAFAIDEAETHMPMIEMLVVRSDVFEILSATIGIPSMYKRRTRSGCYTCPFQRKSELAFLLQERPIEFHRGARYEKLVGADESRQLPAPSLSIETGIAGNWLGLPFPREGEVITGKLGVRGESVFGDQGVWIGAEAFFDGMPGMGEFVYHQRVVSYSTSLAGIKRQLQDRYTHLLRTSEVYQLSPDEVRAQARFCIFFVEAPADILDIAGPGAGSYTWHHGFSYKQMEHILTWGTRILNATAMEEEARAGQNARETSWVWENAQSSRQGLAKVTHEMGRVVCRGWFAPKEPVESEDLDERTTACPMCQI